MQRRASICLVLLVASLVYYNSLDGGFVFDDHRAILTNDDLDVQKTSVLGLFSNDFWGGAMSRKESHKSYRPLTVLSYRYFNHYFVGLAPYSYHLVNVALHAVAAGLFYMVAEVVLGEGEWSTFAALLFAVHSVHTEAVSSVVGRAEVVSCIFFLLSFLSYHQLLMTSDMTRPAARWLKMAASLFFALCSVLSKEQGITVLAVCGAYDVLHHWTSIRGLLLHSKDERDSKLEGSRLKVLPDVIKRVCTLAGVGMMALWMRISLNYGSDPIFKPEEMKAAFHTNRFIRILSFSNIYSWNAWLLLAPSPLCCDWSLGTVPLVESISDLRNLWSAALLMTLLALGLKVLTSKRETDLGLSLSFLVITFIPASSLIFRVGFVIAERVLYLPSLGFCLLVVLGAKRLCTCFPSMTKLVYSSLIYVLIVMSMKTISRNWDWWSDLALFESGVRVNPNNVKLLNNYAMELKSAGRLDESKEHYLMAMDIDSDYSEVYFNYGNLLSELGEYQGAAENFEKAMTYQHMYSKTLNNLATTYFRLGRFEEAEKIFKESLVHNSDQPMTYNNLASLYGEMKKYTDSELMFKKAIQMSPTYTEAYFNLGTLLYQMNRVEEAEQYLNYALKLNPNHHGARNNLYVIEFYKNKKESL